MKKSTFFLLLICFTAVLLRAQQQSSGRLAIPADSSKLVDLTYPFNAQTI
jgi:hypothetical protein